MIAKVEKKWDMYKKGEKKMKGTSRLDAPFTY